VDYAPCLPFFWSSPTVPGYAYSNEEERLDVHLNRLGVDAFVSFGVGLQRHPAVGERAWEEHPAGERYPLIHKIIETPAGELTCTVRKTEDWPTMKRIELCARAGVDFLSRNGFYETTDFWSPAQIERFLVPRLRRELELAHEFELPVAYTVCTGIMPMIEQLRALAFDCLFSIEPVLGDQDMSVIARELGPISCIWGGLSAPIHIGEGTPEKVRAAVREFYETFGKRGTILLAGPSIRPHWAWENVMAMIDEWAKGNDRQRARGKGQRGTDNG